MAFEAFRATVPANSHQTFYARTLGSFFWHHLRDLLRSGYFIRSEDLLALARMAVLKTFTHELFHFCADAISRVSGRNRVFPDEEALAVAWSYQAMQGFRGYVPFSALPIPLFWELVNRMYRYRAHGYRDWVNFNNESTLRLGLASYLFDPAGEGFLRHNGIDTGAMVRAMADAIGAHGVIVQVVP